MVDRLRKRIIPEAQLEEAEREIVDRSRRIDFYLTEYTVEILAQKMEQDEIVVPDYQRDDTWDNARKSRFIESLVIGLPIPFLFFWLMPDGKLEIVDGSQRLRTIHQYLLHNFRLTKLETLKSLSGTIFSDLLESRQRKIKNGSIRGIVLSENTDSAARKDMFDRINTGSLVANTAEIRRGALPGPFLDMVIELSKNALFTSLAPVSAKANRERIREELVTRFFAYGDGLDKYSDSPKQFIFDYTKEMNRIFSEDSVMIDEYRKRFLAVLNFVEDVFPNGFRKTASSNSTPRVRFEAIAIGSYLALQDHPEIGNVPFQSVSGWIDGEEFSHVTTSDAANVKSKILARFNFVRDKLVQNK